MSYNKQGRPNTQQGKPQDNRNQGNNYSSKPQYNKDGSNSYQNQKGQGYGNQGNQGNQYNSQSRPQNYNGNQNYYGGYKKNYNDGRNYYEGSKQPTNKYPPNTKKVEEKKEEDFRVTCKEYIDQVKTFEDKMEQFKKEPTSIDGYYYLLSNKALKEWKEYLDYPNIIADKKPNIHISCKPQKINEDLVSIEKIYLAFPEKGHPCSVVLKPDLAEGKDYIIVNQDVWKFFNTTFPGGTEIKRKGTVKEDGQIELVNDMHVVNLIFIYTNFLKAIEEKSSEPLRIRKFQIPHELNVRTFKKFIARSFNKLGVFKYNLESECLRVWSLDPAMTDLNEFKEFLHQTCKKSRTFDYKIDFNGNLLDRDPSKFLEEVHPNVTEHLVIEINQPGKFWTFYNDQVKACQKCHYCNKIDFLDFHCLCGKAEYCSESCKYAAKAAHAAKCDKAYDSDEDKEVTPSLTPIDGLVGLENLGNTCYMNCSIQCLSNIKEFTEYFLSQKYKSEINPTNPLGTQGKLAKKYAYLIKKLWLDNRRDFAPYSLKLAVSKFQTMFNGAHQHDAQEFLFYLIDAIHEDLNRVLKKPYTETVDGNNRNDFEVGKESWLTFLQRNRSVVVDLMYGQFKSSIQCLKCNNISKTFESFSICSLPIPNQQEIEIFYVFHDPSQKPYRMLLKYPDNNHTLADLKKDIAFLLEKNIETIQLGIGDKYSVKPIEDLQKPTAQVCQELKKQYLLAFELSPEEMKIPPHRRLLIGLQTIQADIPSDQKNIGIVKLIVLDKEWTNQDVHLAVFSKYRFLFDDAWPYKSEKPYHTLSLERACDEAFGITKNPIYEVFIVSCKNGFVKEQVLDYNDDPFEKILQRFKDPQNEFFLEVDWIDTPTFVDLPFLNGFLKYNPYKTGFQDKESGEKRFIDINDCLKSFTRPEELGEDNAWYCKKCEKHQNAMKMLEIYKTPQIFILHLKRFKTGDNTRWNRTESKINDMITFPIEDFDLSSFVTNHNLPNEYLKQEVVEDEAKKDLKYDLFAVIHHIGNLNSGHYITYAKNVKMNAWYIFDDERVRKVENPAEIITDTAYILFYRRKDDN